jgi:hypothetical protein
MLMLKEARARNARVTFSHASSRRGANDRARE